MKRPRLNFRVPSRDARILLQKRTPNPKFDIRALRHKTPKHK